MKIRELTKRQKIDLIKKGRTIVFPNQIEGVRPDLAYSIFSEGAIEMALQRSKDGKYILKIIAGNII
ncbi:MAG: hypothetical protein ACPLSN_07700 [Dictyoglomus turgidum]